jgi:transcriptional regulator with XRE-family HTH domain
MDYINLNISENLKRIRKRKQMSLDTMAMETGISKSMLGQIERGEANPTIVTLGKIISGLRVTLNELVQTPPEESLIIRREKLEPTAEQDGFFRSYNYFPYEQGRNFEVYYFEIDPGGIYERASHGEGTRECLVVVSGTLSLKAGDAEHTLDPGDAICFMTDRTHSYANAGDGVLRIYVTFYGE